MLLTADVINFTKELLIENDNHLQRVINESLEIAEKVEAGQEELISVLEIMTAAIERYEDRNFSIDDHATSEERMVYLMEQHGDTQSDMTDIASRTVINEIVNGKRKLTRTHIERLCRKYSVTSNYFFS